MLNMIATIVTMRDSATLNVGRVEGDVRPGLPGLTLIGFTGDLHAARERVQDALATLGWELPRRRMVIHGTPAAAPMPVDLYVPVIVAVLAGCINVAPRGFGIVAVPESLAGPEADELARTRHEEPVTVPEHNDAQAAAALIKAAATSTARAPF